ncbi:MAG: flagellar basal body P-ring formation protein FlgA [Pirellulales bacterium]|nr:flagellar basal body P-ring formation protein FlgA [Pirellulales bacterium]
MQRWQRWKHDGTGVFPSTRCLVLAAVVFGIAAAGSRTMPAAEFRLRPQYQSDGTLVTLGDVAEIFATDRQEAEALAAVELFTPPTTSRERLVRLREIQDLLLLRGVNLAEHRFSGSSQVTILGGSPPAPKEPQERTLTPSVARRTDSLVGEAIVQYLQHSVSATQSWKVDVALNADQARLVSQSGQVVSIAGGAPPWTGLQRFTLTVETSRGPTQLLLQAHVSLPLAVVVTVRPLMRGTLLRAADVELKRESRQDTDSTLFYSIDEVVGKEITQSIPKGQVLRPRMLRAPLLVRRGDVVTVCARCNGILVRTTARARDDGSLGELIAVESLQDRQRYYARVSKIREVEVLARPVQAGQDEVRRPSDAMWR